MRFNVRFSELKGQGQLVLRVNALRSLPNATATTIATRAHMLADEQDLTLSLDVECETGLTYAILANLMDGEGTAAGLDVTVEAVDTPRDVTGYARATFLAEAAPAALANHVTWGPATLETPVSQMCTARQFREPVYREWTHALNTEPTLHRKQWEFIYILQALRQAGALIPGARGIGFGVGREPLPALFASMGCSVVATDLAADDDRAHDWRETQQHIDSIEALRRPDLCPDLLFDRTVSFHAADMTRIPANLRDFDFTWSSCAFEHLGSIAAGLAFVEASLDCLKPGGVAVHTSEFNLSSNDDTIDDAGTVLFRRRDIETLAIRLLRAGHDVAPLCYDIGTEPIDAHIDVAPYADVPHLKLALAGYVTTSFGLIVRKRTKRRWFGRQGGV
ncbi:hypothetical protein [uncultured Sphingomonas sp.]|uniref:hypothetical protein n=1 Tax=uncultured Sphingomonas sp. TaxID=158754 RepID=UPI0035CAD522